MESSFPVVVANRGVAALDDLEGLMRTHRAKVMRFVAFSIDDTDVAASITQDCFLKAYRSREQFRGDCAVSTWLIRIAYRLICDHTRTERFKFWKAIRSTAVDASELAATLPNTGTSPEHQVIAKQQVKQLLEAVQELPQRQRSVFTLHFVDEMTIDEIATSLAMPTSTVKTHLYRSTAKIRKLLGERA